MASFDGIPQSNRQSLHDRLLVDIQSDRQGGEFEGQPNSFVLRFLTQISATRSDGFRHGKRFGDHERGLNNNEHYFGQHFMRSVALIDDGRQCFAIVVTFGSGQEELGSSRNVGQWIVDLVRETVGEIVDGAR